MPLPILAAAGISAAGSIGSSLLTNAGTKRAAKFAAKENLAQWHRQNAYNDPSAQMARLRAAGLNPNLIYGSSPSGASGNADALPAVKAPEYKIDNPVQGFNQFADYAKTEATTNNLQEHSKVLSQEAILKAAQISDIGIKSARSKFDLGLAKDLRETSLQAAKANLRNTETNTIGTEIDNRFKDLSLRHRVKDIYYRVQNARATLKGTNLSNQLKKYELELNQLGIQKDDNLILRLLGKIAQENKNFNILKP